MYYMIAGRIDTRKRSVTCRSPWRRARSWTARRWSSCTPRWASACRPSRPWPGYSLRRRRWNMSVYIHTTTHISFGFWLNVASIILNPRALKYNGRSIAPWKIVDQRHYWYEHRSQNPYTDMDLGVYCANCHAEQQIYDSQEIYLSPGNLDIRSCINFATRWNLWNRSKYNDK